MHSARRQPYSELCQGSDDLRWPLDCAMSGSLSDLGLFDSWDRADACLQKPVARHYLRDDTPSREQKCVDHHVSGDECAEGHLHRSRPSRPSRKQDQRTKSASIASPREIPERMGW
mmetsp:Transcript_11944/g.28540  ORF Transcript_11944/g.28540 Transcript_11944/m.28540 type:complete len:116 (-) Transcript_11944:31-378(-)